MSRLAVNPTRMELRQLKTRLKTAQRGYKLLKDKSDEMIRQFMIFVRENKALREELDHQLKDALNKFLAAKALTSTQSVYQAFAMNENNASLNMDIKSVMGIDVPVLTLEQDFSEMPAYGFFGVSSETDDAVESLNKLMQKLIRLAQIEKTTNMFACEIEKNRRRVSALENVVIPQITETIKYIVMKLDENERGAVIRLIKTKSMLESKNKSKLIDIFDPDIDEEYISDSDGK